MWPSGSIKISPSRSAAGSVRTGSRPISASLLARSNFQLCQFQVRTQSGPSAGQALYEEVCYDHESGQLLTGSLLDYAVPHADSLPNIRSQFQQTPSPTNPLGVKGIGESGSIGAPPTIVHAVLDALVPFGVTHLDMPLTPQKIWTAIRGAPAAGDA